ncbi:unnamed protein product, partial [marine sediment metagenome]
YNSKLHQSNLKLADKALAISPIHELILFNILQNSDGAKYSDILKFFSSFGVKTEISFRTIVKKLREEDIIYKGNLSSDYEQILKNILQNPKLEYPLTLSVREAYKKFQFLGYKFPSELMDFFKKLANKYPGFISLSPSKIGDASDLITFKEIFIDQIKFYKNNNWDLK